MFWADACVHSRTGSKVIEEPPFLARVKRQVGDEPPCFANCGILLLDPQLQTFCDKVAATPGHEDFVISFLPPVPADAVVCDGYAVAWTDASAVYPMLQLLRRVGMGIF